jgi:hypothetical protein
MDGEHASLRGPTWTSRECLQYADNGSFSQWRLFGPKPLIDPFAVAPAAARIPD